MPLSLSFDVAVGCIHLDLEHQSGHARIAPARELLGKSPSPCWLRGWLRAMARHLVEHDYMDGVRVRSARSSEPPDQRTDHGKPQLTAP
jgi:hypothetical protein